MKKISYVLRIFISAVIVVGVFLYMFDHNNAPLKAGKQKSVLAAVAGEGTKDSPYLIDNAEQFADFRDAVNSGRSFANCYFLQTADLDLQSYSPWIPIGEYQTNELFEGVYDGGGHVIKNLYIDGTNCKSQYVGLFGLLKGTVMNLGIESGLVKGICIGGITSHGVAGYAKIINCFSMADIEAVRRGGGLADDLNGIIINSWFAGEIRGAKEFKGGIASARVAAVYSCFSNTKIYGKDIQDKIVDSETLPREIIFSEVFAQKLNNAINNNVNDVFFLLKVDIGSDDLIKWKFKDGKICYDL